MVCPAPVPSEGMAIGLAGHFDCLSEMLGREGFLAISEHLSSSGTITSMLVISVALIGYHLLFLGRIDLGDGVSWGVRVGIILALLSGWTAFQTLFYDVAVGGPTIIAELLLSALGHSPEETLQVTQRTYDALRLGTLMSPDAFRALIQSEAFAQQSPQLPTAMPEAANAMLVATVGAEGAVKVVVGFLLAIAPLPIAALLFSYSQVFFWGWLKVLLAGFFAIAGLITLNTLHVSALAGSVARVYDGSPQAVSALDDIQAIPVITSVFSLTAVILLIAVLWAANSLMVMTKSVKTKREFAHHEIDRTESGRTNRSELGNEAQASYSQPSISVGSARTVALLDSLNDAVIRERQIGLARMSEAISLEPSQANSPLSSPNIKLARRRPLGRQHVSLDRRDRRR